jgi:hypothetical protein
MVKEASASDILDAQSAEETPVKILVRSKYREVRAKTQRMWEEVTTDGKTTVQQVDFERQFLNWECYMTPEECKFLVESVENKACEAAGDPTYWYPAGLPYPMPVDHDMKRHGVFTAPLRSGNVATSEPQAAAGAKLIEDERAAALAALERRKASSEVKARKAAELES